MAGQNVTLRARIQTSRAQGSKMLFLNLRQQTETVQALLMIRPEKVSKQMLKWATALQDESIVLVTGQIVVPPEIITSASVGNVEVHIDKVRITLHSIFFRIVLSYLKKT